MDVSYNSASRISLDANALQKDWIRGLAGAKDHLMTE